MTKHEWGNVYRETGHVPRREWADSPHLPVASHRRDSPERRLARAVLETALLDATDRRRAAEHRSDAQAWFASASEAPWSAAWVCQHLNVDLERIRGHIAERKGVQVQADADDVSTLDLLGKALKGKPLTIELEKRRGALIAAEGERRGGDHGNRHSSKVSSGYTLPQGQRADLARAGTPAKTQVLSATDVSALVGVNESARSKARALHEHAPNNAPACSLVIADLRCSVSEHLWSLLEFSR